MGIDGVTLAPPSVLNWETSHKLTRPDSGLHHYYMGLILQGFLGAGL